MRSYFSVGQAEGRLRIAMGTPEHEFAVLVNPEKMTDPRVREMITAWALGIFSCPQAGISRTTVDDLLDHLEERYPIQRPLFPRPKLRLW
ncbi:MAG: hypothetical protein H5T92_02735 [Synergistales bacterium]|nr:hypothetical protein [Synergistales bacterium]